jgi:hypothetical protein
MDKAALGLVFSEHFGLPYHSFHQLLHTTIIHRPGLVQ